MMTERPDVRSIRLRQIVPLFVLGVPIVALMFLLAPHSSQRNIQDEAARGGSQRTENRNQGTTLPNRTNVEPPVRNADQEKSEQEKADLERRGIVAAEEQASAARWQTALGIVGFFIAMAVLVYTHLGFVATEKSNQAIKRMNKQWLDTCEWKCGKLFRLAGDTVPIGLTTVFRVKNNTNYLLTLNRIRVHVSVDGDVRTWDFINIDAPLAPKDKYRVSLDMDLTNEQAEAMNKFGVMFNVIGCAFFTDAFGDADRRLFGRTFYEAEGKIGSEPQRTAIAGRWASLEKRILPVMVRSNPPQD